MARNTIHIFTWWFESGADRWGYHCSLESLSRTWAAWMCWLQWIYKHWNERQSHGTPNCHQWHLSAQTPPHRTLYSENRREHEKSKLNQLFPAITAHKPTSPGFYFPWPGTQHPCITRHRACKWWQQIDSKFCCVIALWRWVHHAHLTSAVHSENTQHLAYVPELYCVFFYGEVLLKYLKRSTTY